ncbi:MAG: hypothetical protein QOI24_1258 [Acidobacteriota bacterium]|jgi:hypothetical protein|nr:hypothetical protein [Acidobacteriota bacterium]
MSHEDLLRYWPAESDVEACIKTDAESSSAAVSAAVHQPMRLERRVIGSDAMDLCDEHAVLAAFLTASLPDGRVILPIVGSSGIGKSHVVRWLESKIRTTAGADRRVVIRIPKGTSLRGVLSLLLDQPELQGPTYQRHREEMLRAQRDLDSREAAGLLCEMLAHAVTEMGSEARDVLTATPHDATARERAAFCNEQVLPTLFRNQVLRDRHFVLSCDGHDGPVARLVEQLTKGRDPGVADDRQHLFVPDDLVFDERIERDALGKNEQRALSMLDMRPDRRETACCILNAALDSAKQRLLRLDPTISELFDTVRRELFADGKELILLVEDFAVLSGLQKQLLQIVIKEAIRDGQQVLCTMRTALAYTTGYIDTATVLTRAHVEYRIPDTPGDDEDIFRRIERLVGAYMNATRSGQRVLERAYATHHDGDAWIPAFSADIENEARLTLNEFGASVDGYDLFPFNRAAIRQLAREGSLRSGTLVYNPRYVIQNVLNKVLKHRDLFAKEQFPSARFGPPARPLRADVAGHVRRQVSAAEFDRYERFLEYWGGHPESAGDVLLVPERVYAAFGLDRGRLARNLDEASAPPRPPVPSSSPSPVPPPPVTESSALEIQWRQILEAWRGGTMIPQGDARKLRKWIADALIGTIDWDWSLHKPLKDGGVKWFVDDKVYIPRAAGGGGTAPDDAMVVVCSEADLDTPAESVRIFHALMSVVRFQGIHQDSWAYEGAESDLAHYAAFLSAHAERARDFVRERYFKASWDPVPMLAEGLLIGARSLGIVGSQNSADVPALVNAIFSPVPSETAETTPASDGDSSDAQWQSFLDLLRGFRSTTEADGRDIVSWRHHLLSIIGARQGSADRVYAIDVARLRGAIEGVLASWDTALAPPNPAAVPEFTSVRIGYLELKKVRGAVEKHRQRLYESHLRMAEWWGAAPDKDALYRELKELVESAKAATLARADDYRPVLVALEDFRTARIAAAFSDTGSLKPQSERGVVLTVLGKQHDRAIRIAENLRAAADGFLRTVEEELAARFIRTGDDPMRDALADLTASLDDLTIHLKDAAI